MCNALMSAIVSEVGGVTGKTACPSYWLSKVGIGALHNTDPFSTGHVKEPKSIRPIRTHIDTNIGGIISKAYRTHTDTNRRIIVPECPLGTSDLTSPGGWISSIEHWALAC